MAGGSIGAFLSDPLANWIRSNNPTDEGYRGAVENFIHSCAGNIMINREWCAYIPCVLRY
jgi:hypothetical protein